MGFSQKWEDQTPGWFFSVALGSSWQHMAQPLLLELTSSCCYPCPSLPGTGVQGSRLTHKRTVHGLGATKGTMELVLRCATTPLLHHAVPKKMGSPKPCRQPLPTPGGSHGGL